MLKKVLLSLILMVTNCQGGAIVISECEWFNAGGLSICSMESIDPAEVEELVRVVEEETRVLYPTVSDVKGMLDREGVTASFLNAGGLARDCHETGFDGVFACETLISGQNTNGVEIVAKYYPCLADSSLAHEILHSIQWFELKSSKSEMKNHSTPEMFTIWGFENGRWGTTIQDKVYFRLKASLPSCKK